MISMRKVIWPKDDPELYAVLIKLLKDAYSTRAPYSAVFQVITDLTILGVLKCYLLWIFSKNLLVIRHSFGIMMLSTTSLLIDFGGPFVKLNSNGFVINYGFRHMTMIGYMKG